MVKLKKWCISLKMNNSSNVLKHCDKEELPLSDNSNPGHFTPAVFNFSLPFNYVCIWSIFSC